MNPSKDDFSIIYLAIILNAYNISNMLIRVFLHFILNNDDGRGLSPSFMNQHTVKVFISPCQIRQLFHKYLLGLFGFFLEKPALFDSYEETTKTKLLCFYKVACYSFYEPKLCFTSIIKGD